MRAGDDDDRSSDELGPAPSPLRDWGYPHPLAGESGAR
jgi:hypothetical protein